MRGMCIFCSPHPQPLSHAVGEGCRGARQCRRRTRRPYIFPLARKRERGTKGVRAKNCACSHARAGETVPASGIPCRTVVPLSACEQGEPKGLGSPRFARGTAWGAWVRFPLLAGGTLRRGLSGILVFVNFGCAIGIIDSESRRKRTGTPVEIPELP